MRGSPGMIPDSFILLSPPGMWSSACKHAPFTHAQLSLESVLNKVCLGHQSQESSLDELYLDTTLSFVCHAATGVQEQCPC